MKQISIILLVLSLGLTFGVYHISDRERKKETRLKIQREFDSIKRVNENLNFELCIKLKRIQDSIKLEQMKLFLENE